MIVVERDKEDAKPEAATDTTDDRKLKETPTTTRESSGQRESDAEGRDEQVASENGQTETTPDSTEQRRTDRESDSFEQHPSYGDFANLAEEFDFRAKSRERANALNSRLEERERPDDEPGIFDFKVDDKPLREHIDPEAEDAGAAGGVKTDPEPAGDRTATAIEEGENDERRGGEKFRGALHKNADSVVDRSGKAAESLDDIFGPRPTGHAETRADSGSMAIDTHHSGVDAGSVVSAGLALGIVGAELFRRGREKVKGRDQQ